MPTVIESGLRCPGCNTPMMLDQEEKECICPVCGYKEPE